MILFLVFSFSGRYYGEKLPDKVWVFFMDSLRENQH